MTEAIGRKTSTISNSILHEFSSVIITETAEDDTQEEKFGLKEALPQIFASISATSFHIIVGVTFAATATLLPRVMAPENDFLVSKSEGSWIASIFVVSVPIASLFSGFSMDKIGRLNTIKLSIVPAVISCAVIALAHNVYMIIGGRCLMGIATAFGTNPAVVYITETTSSDYRGPLVSAGPTLSSFGMMLGYLFGALLDWRLVSWINIGFCVIPLVLITVLRIPESPAWLLQAGREEDTRSSLAWIAKWKTVDSREKFIQSRMDALKKVKKEKGVEEEPSIFQKLKGFKKPTGYRPLIIFLILFTFQQYCGVYITTFFAVQFFIGAGSSMNPFYASVLIGLLRFIMSLVTTVLLKHFKRRHMCVISCLGMGLMMGTSGYFTMKVSQTGESSMIPVYCILLYVAFSMIGLLSLPWTMAAEVFPNEIRAIGHGLVIGGAHLVMFVSIQTFMDMVEFFGGYARVQWFFSAMSLLATVFIYYCLPETHGQELSDIQEYFENNTFYPNQKKVDKKSVSQRNTAIVKEPKPKISQGLAALEEYDTLIHREEGKHPTILPMDNNKLFIGSTDTSKLEFIDKSMELLSSASRDDVRNVDNSIAKSPTTVSVPNFETQNEKL